MCSRAAQVLFLKNSSDIITATDHESLINFHKHADPTVNKYLFRFSSMLTIIRNNERQYIRILINYCNEFYMSIDCINTVVFHTVYTRQYLYSNTCCTVTRLYVTLYMSPTKKNKILIIIYEY